ncbi:MAG: hypothetical protein GC139_10525 [Sideroxydans sp.]|nr:hypothetical protein [Sideroxydans sp.]
MDRIKGAGNVGNMFVTEDAATNRPPTEITDAWLNDVQEELAAFPLEVGQPLGTNRRQVLDAVLALIESRAGDFALDTGVGGAYVIALSPAIAAYTGDFSFAFKAANANPGASTIDFGPGPVDLDTDVGGALALNDITVGMIVRGQYVHADGKAYITHLVPSQALSEAQATSLFAPIGGMSATFFDKPVSGSPCFVKTGAGAISAVAGVRVVVSGVLVQFNVDTPVVMPALVAGTDYGIYVCQDGTIRADANWTAPTGYTAGNSRKIGGFHYGLVAAGTTVAGGSFATAGSGMIWTQPSVDDIAGINKYSIWDLKFRPASADPRGMALVGGRVWVDIYLCNTDTAVNGTSKAGSNIVSGTVLPKIPTAFNGDGAATYANLNWWVANELARANQKRLMWEHEFVEAAFGVTENQSVDATAATYPTTLRNAGYTSKFGIEQASGHHWIWGQDTGQYYDSTTWSYKNVTGRGQVYTQGAYGLTRVNLGGSRANGINSGSLASNWNYYPWHSDWSVGLRAACDHVQLA